MKDKTGLIFQHFMDYENGKMARLEVIAGYGLPLNLYVDNASELEINPGDRCFCAICGIGSGIKIFSSENEFKKTDHAMAPISMIPIGTFSANSEDKDFVQSPHILFTGRVLNAEFNPCAGPDEPNYCVTIETLDMNFTLYYRYDGTISADNIIHGVVWLFGKLEKE